MIKGATSQKLFITNTQLWEAFEKQWTRDNGINRRQIDYCLCEWSELRFVANTEACQDIAVGATVTLESFNHVPEPDQDQKESNPTGRKHTLWGWQTDDNEEYKKELDQQVLQAFLRLDPEENETSIIWIEQRITSIEEAMAEVGQKCCRMKESRAHERVPPHVRDLIAQRRQAKSCRDKRVVATLSKSIQKEIRAISRARKRGRIESILKEFKDLQFVQEEQ